MALALSLFDPSLFAAPAFQGHVTFNGLPVPGVTVIAARDDKTVTAITDAQGNYVFTNLEDGAWKFEVEMGGFASQTQELTVAQDAPAQTWELKLLPLEEITRSIPPPAPEGAPAVAAAPANSGQSPAASASAASALPTAGSPGYQRANVNAARNAPPAPAAAPPAQTQAQASDTGASATQSSGDLAERGATGLVVNGSVNNGAATSFAQLSAFGNSRRGPALLYNGGAAITFDTSAWDARSFSLGGVATPKPSYNNVTYLGSLGGPIGLPHHLLTNSQFFVGFQHTASDNAQTQWGLVPTLIERAGNFSQSLTADGKPVQLFNPATNTPYAGLMIPVSPQAQALLNLYPKPNTSGPNNYQAPVLSSVSANGLHVTASKSIHGRNQVSLDSFYQNQTTNSTNLFGFTDSTQTVGQNTSVNYQRFFRPGGLTFLTVNLKYTFSRLSTHVTPYFSNRSDISGGAGILGNDQAPVNWGPPNLTFASGLAGLSEAQYARNANQTQAFSYSSLWYRGKHTLQFGGDVRRLDFNAFTQQNARGTFGFTGASTAQIVAGQPVADTGSALADFVLGTADTAQIAFGNADKYLRGWNYDVFLDDDWRFKPGLTLHGGIRWELAQPFTELKNRLANLDIASGFAAASPVLASNPVGPVTGRAYSNSLLSPDYRAGIEPRLGIAWRPRSNSPLVLRAGYGITDVTSIYQVVAMDLAQQPPLSKTFSLQNSVATPLTLAAAFNTVPSAASNTFAVNPNLRIGYAQDWNASVQQDLPFSLTMTASYLGTKGTHLMQESLPNTNPIGAANACPSCPAGFVYLASGGNSTRHAGQMQIRRRLRNGLTATVQYTYAKAIDDAGAFASGSLQSGGAQLSSSPGGGAGAVSIAQDWRNLRAERSRSSFDQRHLLSVTAQYTTGEGLRGGALLTGWRGVLFKEWTVVSQFSVGSGLPLTPVYPANVPGTGFTGTIRPDRTGAPVNAAPAGLTVNPAAFAAPVAGQWGDAGRNSIAGPSQFSLNMQFSRVFRLSNRLNAQWETSATNILNTVTYQGWNTTFGSPLFGTPVQPGTMRKLQTTFRVRF